MKNRKRRGQALVETALLFIAYFTILIGMVDIGQMLFLHQTLVERVTTAVHWGATNNFDQTSITNLVLYGTTSPDPNAGAFWGLSSSNVSVTNPGCGPNPNIDCHVKVVVSGYQYTFFSFAFITSFWHPGTSGVINGLTIQASEPSELPNATE